MPSMQSPYFCPELGNWDRSGGMGMRMGHSCPCSLMVPERSSSPQATSQKHTGLKQLEQPRSWMLPCGSPFLSWTAAIVWSTPSKSRVKQSASLLRYKTICWQGSKTSSCRWAFSSVWSRFSSLQQCPEALLSASTIHDKGLSGTTKNLCQQKSDPAQKGGGGTVPCVRNTTPGTARGVWSVTRSSNCSKSCNQTCLPPPFPSPFPIWEFPSHPNGSRPCTVLLSAPQPRLFPHRKGYRISAPSLTAL